MPNQNPTLADLATTHPGASRVFLKHGLDFCCRGRRPLDEACIEKGLDPSTVLTEITNEDANSGDLYELASRPIGELVDFIESHYHCRLRAELPDLISMADKVERVHASKPSCPRGLASHLRTIHTAILDHLAKEEQVLFPLLRTGYRDRAGAPIRVMEQEHEDHGRNLEYLRTLTHEFSAPPEACATWKALYLRLNGMSDELMEHIHLENNVVFPRVLCE
ncbi:MAG TPA: iron-sulfur cluster repair di-iron protein [Terriglobales bacterium]|jgi:regulator of cell morphogenesis and NO signaling|nr:iron-sulfur cluster repair di-iron protein [Terriglobales bacterium]